MTTKITLYIGLNDKDTKYQVFSDIEAFKIVTNLLLVSGITGATVYDAKGIFTHECNALIVENTIRVELFDPDENAVSEAIQAIKKALNQECIGYSKEVIEVKFI